MPYNMVGTYFDIRVYLVIEQVTSVIGKLKLKSMIIHYIPTKNDFEQGQCVIILDS